MATAYHGYGEDTEAWRAEFLTHVQNTFPSSRMDASRLVV